MARNKHTALFRNVTVSDRSIKLFLFPGGYRTPPSRYRIHQYYEAFKTLDYSVTKIVTFPDRANRFPEGYWILERLPSRIKQFMRLLSARVAMFKIKNGDIVIANRDIVPEPKITWFEEYLFNKGAKLIFDFDDAIFLGLRRKKLDKILPRCSWVVAGNEYLLDYAKSANVNSSIIPTVVDTELYTIRNHDEIKDKLIIGWSGSAGTVKVCLPLIKGPMEELSKIFDFTFLVIADKDPRLDWEVKDIKFKKWTPETEVEGIKQIDIGIMPLNDTEFERGKCGLKAIQYMAVGTPAIVSPVGVNRKIVDHGVDGYHATTEEEWVMYMSALLQDKEKRKQMGLAAREKIEQQYSLKSAIVKWGQILNSV